MQNASSTQSAEGLLTQLPKMTRHARPYLCHVIALLLCAGLSLALHMPFLSTPRWVILDDASRIYGPFRALDASPTLTTLLQQDPSRSRPMYWVAGYATYKLGGGSAAAFWHSNWIILALSAFAVYGLAQLFTEKSWLALAAPVVLILAPPVVPNYSELSNQEPWMIFFETGFLFFMFYADRLIRDEKGIGRVAGPALACWLLACPFILTKEPAAASLAFPVGWAILALPWSDRATWKKRLLFLGLTFCAQLPWAYYHIQRVGGAVHGEERSGYLSNFAMDWSTITGSLQAYRIMLMPLVWPVLLIPAVALLLTLVFMFTRHRHRAAESLRPLLFFLGIAFIQFAVVLPWTVMTKNLLPAFVGLSIANAVALDCFYRCATGRPMDS